MKKKEKFFRSAPRPRVWVRVLSVVVPRAGLEPARPITGISGF